MHMYIHPLVRKVAESPAPPNLKGFSFRFDVPEKLSIIINAWELFISTPPKTNMTMENSPFEDVFPIEHGDLPASHVSFQGSCFVERSVCLSM